MPILLRLFLAALATLSIPLILSRPAHAAEPAATAGAVESFPRFTVETIGSKGPDIFLIPGLATPREVFARSPRRSRGRRECISSSCAASARAIPVPMPKAARSPVWSTALPTISPRTKLARVRVIGHSLGGFAALELAARKPAGVEGVMIVDALPFAGMIYAGSAATVAMIQPQAAAIRDQLVAQAKAGGTMPLALQLSLSPEGKAKITQWTAQVDLRAVGWALYEDLTTDARPSLPQIGVPLTILVPLAGSEAEQAQTKAIYTAAYATAPKAKLILDGGQRPFRDAGPAGRVRAARRGRSSTSPK